jgi:hypothetical protein
MDHTPQLSVHNEDLEEAIGLIKEFLASLDCVTDVKVEDDGSVQFKHKWSAVRFLSEAIKQYFKGDYRPGLDVWGALQDYLIEHHIESRLERWD